MTEKKPKNLTSTTNELMGGRYSNHKKKHITLIVERNFEYPLQTEIDINSVVPIELSEELKSFMDDTENRLNKLADRLMENEIFKETCAKRSLKD